MYDLLIENGTVVDGSGGARYQADVGIEDGQITAIGRTLPRFLQGSPSMSLMLIQAVGYCFSPAGPITRNAHFLPNRWRSSSPVS